MLVSFLSSIPWWGWLVGLVAAPIALVVFLLSKATVMYQIYKRSLPAEIPRHEKTMMITELWDVSKPVDLYFEGMMNPTTGTYHPIMNAGPYTERPYLFVSDPDALKQILTSNDFDHFPKLRTTYDFMVPLIGDGLVTSSGDIWHRHRHLLTPLFHFNVLKKNASAMVDFTRDLIDNIDKKGPNEWLPAKSILSHHALRIIVSLAFGDEFDPNELTPINAEMNRLWLIASLEMLLVGEKVTSMIPFSYYSRLGRVREKLAAMIRASITNRRALLASGNAQIEDQSDLIGVMILSKDENGIGATDQEIVNEVLTFQFAGYDTSASTMCMMMWMLGQHPDVVRRLHEEVDSVLQGRAPTLDDIGKLKYLKNVVRETQRLWPIVPWVDRTAKHDVELCGHKIPAGTGLALSFFCAQRDSRYYEDPEVFNPDRWDAIDNRTSSKPFHAYAFLPFSAGGRNCIGQKFALQEIMITMSMLLQKYNIKYDESKKPYYSFDVVSIPSNLFVKFIPRDL